MRAFEIGAQLAHLLFELPDAVAILLHLAGDARKLRLDRFDARGEVGNRVAGRAVLLQGGDCRLQFGIDGGADAAGEDPPLHRAHLLLQAADAPIQVRLRGHRGRRPEHQEGEEKEATHNTDPADAFARSARY
jgi:hypothetical protein